MSEYFQWEVLWAIAVQCCGPLCVQAEWSLAGHYLPLSELNSTNGYVLCVGGLEALSNFKVCAVPLMSPLGVTQLLLELGTVSPVQVLWAIECTG